MTNLESVFNPIITKEQIKSLEKELLKAPQCNVPVVHRYLDGLYCREVFMKKGTLLTSKTHKTENISVISKGKVVEVTEKDEIRVIEAPFTMISPAGMKRVLYIIEDTVWTTFHKNAENKTDLKELELMIIDKDMSIESESQKCLG